MGAFAEIIHLGLAALWPAVAYAGETNTPGTNSGNVLITQAPTPPAYTARSWQTDEGLPNNLVRAIAQTPDGYLWVGTRTGLAKFDGIHFISFTQRNTPALKNPNISALCVGQDGSLWIGTYGGGLLHLQAGRFSHYAPTNGLAGDELSSLYCARDGSVWNHDDSLYGRQHRLGLSFHVLSSANANGSYAPASGANITGSGGSFIATAPTSGSVQFYRIKE